MAVATRQGLHVLLRRLELIKKQVSAASLSAIPIYDVLISLDQPAIPDDPDADFIEGIHETTEIKIPLFFNGMKNGAVSFDSVGGILKLETTSHDTWRLTSTHHYGNYDLPNTDTPLLWFNREHMLNLNIQSPNQDNPTFIHTLVSIFPTDDFASWILKHTPDAFFTGYRHIKLNHDSSAMFCSLFFSLGMAARAQKLPSLPIEMVALIFSMLNPGMQIRETTWCAREVKNAIANGSMVVEKGPSGTLNISGDGVSKNADTSFSFDLPAAGPAAAAAAAPDVSVVELGQDDSGHSFILVCSDDSSLADGSSDGSSLAIIVVDDGRSDDDEPIGAPAAMSTPRKPGGAGGAGSVPRVSTVARMVRRD